MNRFSSGRRLSIRTVVGVSLAVIMVATAFLVYFTLRAVENSNAAQEKMVLAANQTVMLEDIRAEYLSAWLFGVSSENSLDEQFLTRFDQARARADWAFAVLRDNAAKLGPTEVDRLKELSARHDELTGLWEPAIWMLVDGTSDEDRAALAAGIIERNDAFVDELASEVFRHRFDFNAALDDYHKSRDEWQASALSIGALWMLLVIAAAYASRRWLLRPLRDVARSARLVAAGELNSLATVGGPAEIASLAADVNMMAVSILSRSRELSDYLSKGLEARTQELEAANEALRTSEARLNAVIESAPLILFALDSAGVCTLSKGAGLAPTGFAPGEIDGRSVFELLADEPEALRQLDRALGGEIVTTEIHMGDLSFETHLAPLTDGDGSLRAVIGVGMDITARKKAEDALRQSEERYRELFENANDLIFTHGIGGRFTAANKAAIELFGYSEEELLNMSMEDVLSPDMMEVARSNLTQKLQEGKDRTTYEVEVRTKDGELIPLEVSSRLVFENGQAVASQGIARDIRDRRRAEDARRRYTLDLESLNAQLAAAHADLEASKRQVEEKSAQLEKALEVERAQARIDPLTGALNHGAIVEELRHIVEREGRRSVVVMLDIDGMKAANDLYGHPFGDQVLKAVKDSLSRDGALVGRYGGDEFVAILSGAGRQEAEAYAEGVREAIRLAGLRDPQAGTEVPIVVSLGLCLYPEEADRIEDLIALADTAMYANKRQRPVHAADALTRRLGGEPAIRMLGEIVALLNSGGALKQRLALVAEKLASRFDYASVEILINPWLVRGNEILATYPRITDETVERGFIEQRLAGVDMRALLEATRRAVVIDKPATDSRLLQSSRDFVRSRGIRCVAVVPLFWEERLIGTMAVASEREQAFGPIDGQLLMGIAGHLADLVAMPAVLDETRGTLRDLRAWGGEGARMLAEVADAHAGAPTHDFDRLRGIAEKLARRFELSEDEAKQVGIATMLHDVGKYLVPKELLSRPDKLSEDEWQVMRLHTVWGYQLLSKHPRFALAAQVARWHHERWDGRGYPDGLVGDEIPLAAAIATVADALDAMVYDRVYREGRSPEAALRELVAGSGRQFSPRVVEALVALIDDGELSLLGLTSEALKAA